MEDSKPVGGNWIEKYGTPLALFAGLIVIAGAIAYGKPSAPSAPTGDKPVAVNIKEVKADSSPVIGEKSAKVAMAVWFDYQCPFCKRFEQEAMAQVYENYVKTGKVRIILKDFQFLGPDSDTAALFARAVWEAYPDKFYTWYVAMADNQDEEHGGFGDLASIQAMTKALGGIDVDRVTKLMTSKTAEYQAAIEADRAEGVSFGVNGTPSAIIGTTIFSGAESYAKVSALLDAELKK